MTPLELFTFMFVNGSVFILAILSIMLVGIGFVFVATTTIIFLIDVYETREFNKKIEEVNKRINKHRSKK